jgi:ABC-2 type transport system ATP-binding protein
MAAVVKVENLSKWYGNVLGISDISLEITSGIKGLLGPNGAGKSTFLKIIGGQLKPNIGSCLIFDEPVFSNHTLFSRVGFCPEYDSYYREISGWDQVMFMARLHGFRGYQASEKTKQALGKVGLLENRHKLIREYSLGMRQRLKFAASVVHEPEVLMLDEPLRGIDPLWRVKIIHMIKEFEKQGRTVIVASHILPEIEAMTNDIILIHQGKVFAQGDIQYIRNLMDAHPHMISVRSSQNRRLASLMIDQKYILNIHFQESEQKVMFNTNNRDQFFELLNRLIVEKDIEVEEISSPDDNLQAVFDYLIGR